MSLKKNSLAEIYRQLVEVYDKRVMSRKQVCFSCTEFDNLRTDMRDEIGGRCWSQQPPISSPGDIVGLNNVPRRWQCLPRRNFDSK